MKGRQLIYLKLWPRRGLFKGAIPVAVGAAQVLVAYEGQTANLPLIVVNGKGATLLGRN